MFSLCIKSVISSALYSYLYDFPGNIKPDIQYQRRLCFLHSMVRPSACDKMKTWQIKYLLVCWVHDPERNRTPCQMELADAVPLLKFFDYFY